MKECQSAGGKGGRASGRQRVDLTQIESTSPASFAADDWLYRTAGGVGVGVLRGDQGEILCRLLEGVECYIA